MAGGGGKSESNQSLEIKGLLLLSNSKLVELVVVVEMGNAEYMCMPLCSDTGHHLAFLWALFKE